MNKACTIGTALLFILSVALFFAGCVPVKEKAARDVDAPDHLVQLVSEEIPPLEDDLDIASLCKAIERSLAYYNRLPEDRIFRFGKDAYTTTEMKTSLVAFRDILRGTSDNRRLMDRLREEFNIYQCLGRDGEGSVLYTGYYEPVLEGSKTRTADFPYPIYRRPDDHVVVDLGAFLSKYKGERIIARVDDGKIVPYYTRRDIDVGGRLKDKGLEIAWLSDPVDIFFLHIQGSGTIRFADGSSLQVSYAQSNGRAYRSLGRHLVEQGRMSIGEISLEGIKRYLRDHPDEMHDLLAHNESYVFFRVVDEGPRGSLDVPVTAGRSIATDPAFFPQGAPALIKVKKPIITEKGEIQSWMPFTRFVLNQDAGGAIKGAGRVDLFCGTGARAGIMAGHLKEYGELYFLMKK